MAASTMFKAVMRKPHTDPAKSGVIETEVEVNNKFHARALARKIVSEDSVAWAEVREIRGRFAARATLGRGGTISDQILTGRRAASDKSFPRSSWKKWIGTLGVLLLVAGLLLVLAFPRASSAHDSAGEGLADLLIGIGGLCLLAVLPFRKRHSSAHRR